MRDLGNRSSKTAMTQSFLETSKHCFFVSGFDINHAVRRQACLGQGRRKQIWSRDAPKNLAFRASSDTGNKQRGRRAIDRAVPATCNLVKGSKSQPVSGQTRIHCCDPERKHRLCALIVAFDMPNAGAQGFHSGIQPHQSYSLNVNVRYLFCSFQKRVKRGTCSMPKAVDVRADWQVRAFKVAVQRFNRSRESGRLYTAVFMTPLACQP
ncbi:hypothetical protein G6N74_28565 [Mesorhizobium sp. CGMCC 1.15528]|uniref:Uncharacterized protein n=1 Tax=Mesorhizobium zhangyense TaxID=1776730 RepID=A0A7C9RBP3_9HYPH|nr:hypothetical protein [Mesorhizobium zhangyense]